MLDEYIWQKAPSPILVTELGIIMDVKLLQPEKEFVPILVIEVGILMLNCYNYKKLLLLYLKPIEEFVQIINYYNR